jgi:hypothetical protein
MIVQKSHLLLDDREARIVAGVRSEAGNFTPFEIVIGVPRAYVGWLDLTGNPFVPTLLMLASVLGERLRLEGTVSPLLLGNTKKACELFRSWWGIAPVAVEAEAVAGERCPGKGSALFFTRGVDSWHSALRDRADEHPGQLTHLLYAPDFDRQYSPGTRRRALELTREAAGCIGLPLIPISHNGRELLDGFVNWELAHGGLLAGIGLALGGWIADVLTASSMDSNHLIPWGSDPDLDPLWSTERTTIHVDGVEVTRTNKVIAIASSDRALSRLKVCWREDIDTNCGRCDKCLRTQCALAIAGALERAPVFLETLSLQAVLDLPSLDGVNPGSAQEALWSELCESFPDEPRLAELRSAACRRLPARHPLATVRQERDSRWITIEAPSEAAASLLPASAGELLPVPVNPRAGLPDAATSTCHVEITWTVPAPGRIPLPLRPPLALGLEILDACRVADDRPSPWCLIAFDSRETARLMERLTESWGQGVACLTRKSPAEGDHGIPDSEASRIQQCSETRVWWGGGEYLDPFLVLEALRHGCLPLQCVPQASYDALAACLPPGLSHFTLAIPEDGPVPQISSQERAARIDAGLSIILSGNLERDLEQIIPSLNRELI